MNNDEKDMVWRERTDDVYQAIGKFVVKFELICFAIRTGITWILHNQGLQNQSVTQIILAGYNAEPLRTLFESLVNELYVLNDDENKIVKNAINRFQALIFKRNNLVHGTWFVGVGGKKNTTLKTTPGYKLKKSKDGAARISFNYSTDDFENLITEAISLSNVFFRIQALLSAGLPIDDGFEFDENGNIQVQEGLGGIS